MKALKLMCLMLLVLLFTASSSMAVCNKIQSGGITDINGNPITTGFDKYGYNYQAHMFNGLYDNFSRPATPVTTGDVNLIMKWSDEWISNLDCDLNGKLDRGLDAKTGLSDGVSKGWLTNHEEGDHALPGEEPHHYTYFVKIVWVGPAPAGADPWTGKRIWGQYAVIEEVWNDPYCEYNGVLRDSLVHPSGFGYYTN